MSARERTGTSEERTPAELTSGPATRVLWLGSVASTLLWFDVFIFSTTVLVFGARFFPGDQPDAVTMASLGSIAISLVFRPVGSVLSGWAADRFGRRHVAGWACLAGGGGTAVAFLPDYDTLGLFSPLLLVILRAVQGMASGAVWSGLMVLAVELSPRERTGRAGATIQLGSPLAFVLTIGISTLLSVLLGPSGAYADWGWRLAFLPGLALLPIGWFARRFDESPAYERLRTQGRVCLHPVWHVIVGHPGLLIGAGALIVGGNGAAGLLMGSFVPDFSGGPAVDLESFDVFLAGAFGALIWAFATYLGGVCADVFDRRRTLIVSCLALIAACFPVFPLLHSGSVLAAYAGLLCFAFSLGILCGARAAFVAELFPVGVRGSGVSIAAGVGILAGNLLAPLVSASAAGTSTEAMTLSATLAAMLLISLLAVLLLPGRRWDERGRPHACSRGACARPPAQDLTSAGARPRPSR